jgi:type III pantothenate kinase
MNLVIDIGNTLAKFAVFDNHEMIIEYRKHEQIPSIIKDILNQYPTIEKCIISNVGKEMRGLKENVCKKLKKVYELTAQTPLPIQNDYNTKTSLGKDRLAAVVGAYHFYKGFPILVIDVGTAITFDFISKGGVFEGGNISPGYYMRFKALHSFTENLPMVNPVTSDKFIGKSTNEAINLGVRNGIIYEIDSYINYFRSCYSEIKVIATGGDINFFVKNLKNTIFVVSNLTLIGLNEILEYNAKTN